MVEFRTDTAAKADRAKHGFILRTCYVNRDLVVMEKRGLKMVQTIDDHPTSKRRGIRDLLAGFDRARRNRSRVRIIIRQRRSTLVAMMHR